jgi:RAB protein geranylgeranyltransferase component A
MSRKNEHDLNEDGFDYIILGSNLTENILGAGLSIQGSKCLYIDKNNRYGGHLSNFNMEHLCKYIKEKKEADENNNTLVNQDGYHSFHVLKKLSRCNYKDLNAFRTFSRNCNIDLAPKILFSKSVSVTELIRSGVANYLEFQNITDTFFYSK